jgi:hypothetical protein
MGKIGNNGTLTVVSVVLDALFQNQRIPTPDYMKIDIEGSEFLALKGASSMLAKSHPTIFLATHGSKIQQECCNLLRSLDYKLQPIDRINIGQSSEILATHEAGSKL